MKMIEAGRNSVEFTCLWQAIFCHAELIWQKCPFPCLPAGRFGSFLAPVPIVYIGRHAKEMNTRAGEVT